MAIDRDRLVQGGVEVPRVGSVVAGSGRRVPPFVVLDGDGVEVEPVDGYLRDLALSDMSSSTGRSYAYDLLRWWRLLTAVEVRWDQATEAEVALLVGWLRAAGNPQRRRATGSDPAGSVNLRTGKPSLRAGYAPRTINHSLSVISGFYEFHGRYGRGPVVNPVPGSAARRQALAHRSPLEEQPVVPRARLRQKVIQQAPRAIPDALWDELFGVMRHDRDRALLLFYVSSGARASELLKLTLADVDWAGLRIWVVSKGTRLREAVPADPQAFVYLARYLDGLEALPADGVPVWQTLRGEARPVTYWAMRRVVQRANERLGTNWTLHDLRHTAATRMAGDPALSLTEVQRIMRHAHADTTGVYTRVRVEDVFDKLQQHYHRPRVETTYPAGYDPEDVAVVFGG